MKRALIGLSAVLGAALVLWAWLALGSEPARSPFVPAQASASTSSEAGNTELLDGNRALATDSNPADVARRAAETVPQATDAQLGPDERLLRGTLVVRDEHGRVHAHEHGMFVLRPLVTGVANEGAVAPLRTQGQTIQVKDGRWEARLDRRTEQVHVSHVELGGRAALVGKDAELVAVPLSGGLELVADWHASTRLRVTGWDTDADLGQVDVVYFTQSNRSSGIPTGIDDPGSRGAPRVVARRAQSPITIAPDLGMLPFARGYFWARAPGYAWDRIEIDLSQGGERTLKLEPGADIDVHLAGEVERGSALVLRVRELDERSSVPLNFPIIELGLAPAQDRLTIEAVRDGRYLLSVERGESGLAGVVDERSELLHAAPSRSAVWLQLVEPEVTEPVPVSGTLFVPLEWGHASYKLTLQQESLFASDLRSQELTVHRTGANDGVFDFKFDAVAPGRYALTVSNVYFSTMLDVEPPGLSDMDIRVPPPVHVRVRTVGPGGETVPVEELMYHSEVSRSGNAPIPLLTANAQPPGTFDLLLCAGAVQICPRGAGLAWKWKRFEIAPGTRELELPVDRSQGVDLVLADGDSIVPWGKGRAKARRLDGDGRSVGWGPAVDGQRVTVDQAGSYRFEIPPLDGFLPIPEQDVIIEPGKFTTHKIELVRAP